MESPSHIAFLMDILSFECATASLITQLESFALSTANNMYKYWIVLVNYTLLNPGLEEHISEQYSNLLNYFN